LSDLLKGKQLSQPLSLSGSFSGSFQGDGTGITNIISASYAGTASYAPFYTLTSSFNNFTSSYYGDSASFDQRINAISSSAINTGSFVTTSSFGAFTSSYYVASSSFDFRINNISASSATKFFDLQDVYTSSLQNGDLFAYDSASGGLRNFHPSYSINTIQNGLVNGGIVTWLSDYNYNVSAATYYINNTYYSSPSTNLTLAPSDPTLDRIDVFALTTASMAIIVSGSPSSTPDKPDIDTDTELEISFALVLANSTSPGIVTQSIYRENNPATEWSGSATTPTRFFLNSTTSPYQGTFAIEASNSLANDFIDLKSSVSPNISNYNILNFQIKSKTTWVASKTITFLFLTGTASAGNTVVLSPNTYGFVSSNSSSYQSISIPLSAFGNISNANGLRIRRTGNNTGAFPGFYLDNIVLLSTTSSNQVQNIVLQGDVLGSGTGTINTTLTSSGVVPGTYTNATVTVDSKGRVTSASNGSAGSLINTGSFVTTSSFNAFTSSYKIDSASFLSNLSNLSSSFILVSSSYVNFSSSFIVTSASFDARINNITSSFNTFTSSYQNDSASFAARITTDSQSFTTFSSSFITTSASFDNRINNITSSFNLFTSSYKIDSASWNSQISQISASYYAFTQSYYGDSASFDARINSISGSGGSINTGSFVTTSSFNAFTSSYQNDSASFASRITTDSASLATFSASYVTNSSSFDARIKAISGSYVTTSSFNIFTASYITDSASFALRITTDSASLAIFSGSYVSSSASFDTRINNIYIPSKIFTNLNFY